MEVSNVEVQYPYEDEPWVLGGRLSNPLDEHPRYAPVTQSNRTAISIYDLDVFEADGELEVLLTATHGLLTITRTDGLQFLRPFGTEPPIAFEEGQQNPVNGNGVGKGTSCAPGGLLLCSCCFVCVCVRVCVCVVWV